MVSYLSFPTCCVGTLSPTVLLTDLLGTLSVFICILCNVQEMICDEQLPDQLPEPNEAALQHFLADALAFSPPRPQSGTAPPFYCGGSFLDGGGDGGSLAVSPLPRLEHQMFYGGPLGDLGTAAFVDLADSSFSFGCFT